MALVNPNGSVDLRGGCFAQFLEVLLANNLLGTAANGVQRRRIAAKQTIPQCMQVSILFGLDRIPSTITARLLKAAARVKTGGVQGLVQVADNVHDPK